MKIQDDGHVRRAFGMALRALRLRAGHSQEELADGAISHGRISEMEHGQRDPTLTTLIHLAGLLDIPLHRLAWEIELQYRQLVFEAGPEVHLTAVAVEDGVLVVTLAGTAEFHAGLRLYREILDLAQQNQVKGILMDCLEVSGVLPDHERAGIATELSAYFKERQMNLKLATVGAPPTVNGQGARVAREHGANLEVFDSAEAARKWLDQ